MPAHTLREKLSYLRYEKIISDKDYDRLCKALDNENAFSKIRAEIDHIGEATPLIGTNTVIDIIDKWRR